MSDNVQDKPKESRAEKLTRLRNLHLKMNEARKLNHQEVVEEDRKAKLPNNWEVKQSRIEYEEEQEKIKKECEARGEDYNIIKMRNWTADEVDHWERKRKKKNPDTGFADFEQASYRQYQRLTKQMKPDQNEYAKEKEKLGEEIFYAGTNTLGTMEHKDTPEAINRMVDDLEKQVAKRAKYSRRRMHDEDEDIDYINERNMKFNKKLERFYGQYTAEIKQNLERGTAI